MKIFIAIVVIVLFLLLGFFILTSYQNNRTLFEINSFASCKDAGYPVLESYPEQCMTPDGRNFTNTPAAPKEITITGEMVCLPHRNTSGPQTLECAFGLKSNGGKYYALRDSDPEYSNISSASMGEQVTVNGTFTSQNNSKYQDIGIILVDSITTIE